MRKHLTIIFYFFLLFPLLTCADSFSKKDNNHVIELERGSLPLITVNLLSLNGSMLLDKNGGELSLIARILEQSSIAQLAEKSGAKISVNNDKDFFSIHFTVLSDEALALIKNFVEKLKEFKITHKDLGYAKSQQQEALKKIDSNPTLKSYLLFQNKVYGTHPYSKNDMGSLTSLKQITLEDVNTIYKKIFTNPNLYLIAVGNVKKVPSSFLEKMLQSFPKNDSVSKSFSHTFNSQAQTFHFPLEGLSQSFISIGTTTPAYSLSSWGYLQILREAIGGGLSSRLFLELRAKHGYTYSPMALYNPKRLAGDFAIVYSTQNKFVNISLTIIDHILKDIKEKGITQEELSTAKKLLLSSLKTMTETNESVSSFLGLACVYHLPLNYLEDLNKNINEMTLSLENDFIKKYFTQTKWIKVIIEKK
jgi:zinc protease